MITLSPSPWWPPLHAKRGGTAPAPTTPTNALVWHGEPLVWRGEVLTWR